MLGVRCSHCNSSVTLYKSESIYIIAETSSHRSTLTFDGYVESGNHTSDGHSPLFDPLPSLDSAFVPLKGI